MLAEPGLDSGLGSDGFESGVEVRLAVEAALALVGNVVGV